MFTLVAKVKAAVALIAMGVTSMFGGAPAEPIHIIGANPTIPQIVALFETSLAAKISATATTATLVSATTQDGTTLSGTYGFIIDEGASNEEFVICTATATALTACTRGVSVTNPKTSVTALKEEHRRGASVKITNYPQLSYLTRLANGDDTFPNHIYRAPGWSFSGIASNAFATIGYVGDTSFAGTVDASNTVKGIGEIATTAEIQAGTNLGGTGASLLVNPSFLALSSYSSQLLSEQQELALSETAGGNYGTPSSTNKFLTQYVASSSSVFLPVVRTYTASTSWSKPAGLKYIVVQLCGGGGAGATALGTSGNGASGGGGGYAKELIAASALNASELVVIASISGTSYFKSFATIQASGGTAASTTNPGQAGAGTNGDVNIAGQGGNGGGWGPGTGAAGGGNGGSSYCGGGGAGGAPAAAGQPGTLGGGGGGGGHSNTSNGAGGAGSKGYIIIEEHYI